MREREQGARFRWRASQHTQHDLIQIQILDASKEAGSNSYRATGFSSCSLAGKELGRRKKLAYYSETPPRFPVWASEKGAREGLGHPHTLALTIDYNSTFARATQKEGGTIRGSPEGKRRTYGATMFTCEGAERERPSAQGMRKEKRGALWLCWAGV